MWMVKGERLPVYLQRIDFQLLNIVAFFKLFLWNVVIKRHPSPFAFHLSEPAHRL